MQCARIELATGSHAQTGPARNILFAAATQTHTAGARYATTAQAMLASAPRSSAPRPRSGQTMRPRGRRVGAIGDPAPGSAALFGGFADPGARARATWRAGRAAGSQSRRAAEKHSARPAKRGRRAAQILRGGGEAKPQSRRERNRLWSGCCSDRVSAGHFRPLN